MARKPKKWYVVLVGKSPGVYETWSEVAPLVSGVPGAIHESFNTIGEASRNFAQARDNGVTKVVEHSSSDSKGRVGTPKTPPSHESVRASPSRSSPRVLATPKSRRSPLLGSPWNMAEAPLPLPTTTLHPDLTYTRGPSSSSSHVFPTTERRTSSRSPRVIVRTPYDIQSYPSDTEEPSSPITLSKSFSDHLNLGGQSPQQEISSLISTPMKTHQTSNNLSPVLGDSPPSDSMEPLVLDITLSPLDSLEFFTPKPKDISPLASSPSIRGDRLHASLSSPESSLCPKCDLMFKLEPSYFPEMKEETALETPFDPRSPLSKSSSKFGSQLSRESKGRLSPGMKAQPPMSLLLST
ncbi:hypothetical protein E4T56_gene7445 [Termitomyces sp. T112]|nr:hypothetical protein E4T56_gene7445 [Termitomyces sp. T112]